MPSMFNQMGVAMLLNLVTSVWFFGLDMFGVIYTHAHKYIREKWWYLSDKNKIMLDVL